MAATELKNGTTPAAETKATELSVKVAQQVFQILEEAGQREKAPQPVLAYRMPSPGVRYYFGQATP